jgi:hypothetical protein
MRRGVVRCLLLVAVLAVCAQAWAGAPAQFEVVEQFAAQLSAGFLGRVRDVLATGVVHTEHELFVRSVAGPEVNARLRELINQGARLEVAFESASAGGAVIVTREEMWLDDVSEHLLPLRSTGVYVVDGGRVLSITRLLDADQRDALMRETVVGDWLTSTGWSFRLRADGTYDLAVGARASDSGHYTIEGGVLRIVSDDETVDCRPGDVGLWRYVFTSHDRIDGERLEDTCHTSPRVDLRRITE